MPTITFRGEQYPIIGQDKLTPGEIDAVERVTDLTFQRIRRMGETCVCEHGLKPHTHEDEADTSCTLCDCEGHEADLPMRINTAFVWVSIKRVEPTVKFSDVADTPFSDLQGAADEAGADPLDEPLPVEA